MRTLSPLWFVTPLIRSFWPIRTVCSAPDFPGVAKRVVEELTGAACLYLQGCAGNMMTIEALTGDLGAAERMGTMLGARGRQGVHRHPHPTYPAKIRRHR